ncbi:MAG: hypothetical protein V4577_12715 [Bacteroidota bacterium]
MKKIYLFLAAIILTINISFAQAGWVDYKVDTRVSAKLPTAPQTLMEGTVMSLTPDSTVCIITKVDFKASANLDSAALAPLLGTEEFATGLRTGMLQQMAGFTLSETKTGKLHGQYSYSLDGVNEGQKLKSYTLMVVIGQYLYSFTALVKDGRDTKHRDELFASIQIK